MEKGSNLIELLSKNFYEVFFWQFKDLDFKDLLMLALPTGV